VAAISFKSKMSLPCVSTVGFYKHGCCLPIRPLVVVWMKEMNNQCKFINQVVGWGLDERDEPTETLMMVNMPVVSQQACIRSDPTYYIQFTSNGTFCAGYRNGTALITFSLQLSFLEKLNY
jgi:hypothetical protein